jgi:hypothetical protein
MTAGTALTPARPLAAQAHALHAAAIFLKHAATTGLSVTVDASAFITVQVPDQLGDPAARAALVTALAAAAGGRIVRSIALGCAARYRTTGYGQLAGHPVTITTSGAQTR